MIAVVITTPPFYLTPQLTSHSHPAFPPPRLHDITANGDRRRVLAAVLDYRLAGYPRNGRRARDELAKLEAEQAERNEEIKSKRLDLPYTNGACPACSNLADGLRRFE
jgi:hypothetical protein